MPYSKTTWVNHSTKLSPAHLNNIEDGIAAAPYGPDAASGDVPASDGVGGWSYGPPAGASSATNLTVQSGTGLSSGDTIFKTNATERMRLTFAGGLTMSSAIAMGSNLITGLAAGTSAGHAVRFEQVAPVLATMYGAVGDGTVGAATGTNNTTTIAAAITAASTGPVSFPTGLYRTTVAASTLSGPFMGAGQVITTESGPAYNARGKTYNAVTAYPNTAGLIPASPFYFGDPATAFNGGLSHASYVVEHPISGANTLGSIAHTTGNTVNGNQTWAASPGHDYLVVNFDPAAQGFSSTSGSKAVIFNASTGATTTFTYTGLTSTRFTGITTNYGSVTDGWIVRAHTLNYFVASEAGPFLGYLDSSTGRSGAASSGRTGIGFFNLKVTAETNSGGDHVGLFLNGKAYGVSAGAACSVNGDQTYNSSTHSYLEVDVSPIANGYVNPGGAYNATAYIGSTAFTYTGLSVSAPWRFTGCSNYGTATNGSTVSGRWDQNSSVGMWAGSMGAGANGVFLDIDEISANDGGFDVTAIGMVRTLYRSNDSGDLGTFWNGTRIQSTGTVPIDVGHLLYGGGGYQIGFDVSGTTLATNAAMTLKRGQGIYFNASGTDSRGIGLYGLPDSVGTDRIFGTSSGGGQIHVSVGATSPVLQIFDAGLIVNGSGGLSVTGAALNMNTHRITNVSPGVASGNAVAWQQLYGSPSGAMADLLFPGVVDLQVFGPNAGTTWTKPASGSHVLIVAIGAGGGGGGGVGGANSLYGGSGGGCGDAMVAYLPYAAMPSTANVQVGAGGAGGAGSATTTGTAGSNGSRSTIFDTGNSTLIAPAGGGGGAGGTGVGAAGAAAAAGTATTYTGYTIASIETVGTSGGQSSITTNAGTGSAGAGAGGGGITSGGAVAGNGGPNSISNLVYASGAISTTTPGAMGAVLGVGLFGGFGTATKFGAGGGGAKTTGTAGAGGAGFCGGGGGGGGSEPAGGTGGAGGVGGDGRLVVVVFA